MKVKDELRVQTFKRILKKNGIEYLNDIQDEELLELLNLTVLPNSLDINTIRNTHFYTFLFIQQEKERERVYKDLEKIKKLNEELTKTERVIFKFGVVKGFLSRNWRKEMYRYIHTPLGIEKNNGGKKVIYSKTFEEIFNFVYNVVIKGERNGRFPRF